jgi:hypothetical protein
MTWTRGDERSTKERARSTPGLGSGRSLSAADLATSWRGISWYASFSGVTRLAGEAVKMSTVGKMVLLKFRKGRVRATGRRHTLAVTFTLTREGKVFEGVATYVVGMKRQKWAKSWLLASASLGNNLLDLPDDFRHT